jgi:NAD(P)-dependent dehydrogenase (short-subunit alcohol dehydrogenase family)
VTLMEETPGATSRGRVEGKVAVVTGAGQVDGPGVGTGKASSLLLARHGARLVLVDREPERAEVTRKEIEQAGGEAIVVAGDVTAADDCQRMIQAAVDAYGGVDILVNNVGVSTPGTILDHTEEVWDRMLTINLKSVFLVSKQAIPVMVRGGGGSIVNISSVGALRSIGFPAYSAAKGGMISLSREMAGQHGRDGIRVNVVVPGNIQTPRNQGTTAKLGTDVRSSARRSTLVLPLGRTGRGTGWDIAYAVLFFASDESSWMTGQVLTADGGADVTNPVGVAAQLEASPTAEDDGPT